MSALRAPIVLVATTLGALAACTDSPSEPVLGDDAVVRNATLEVTGGPDADDIRVTADASGIRVQIGAASGLFEEAIGALRVTGGGGNDLIRIQQSVVRDLELDVAGGEGDDEIGMTFAPSGTGAISLVARVDGGAGSDAIRLFWDSKGEDLDVSVSLTVDGTITLPEVDDEVLVSFEGGDPDRPVIVGGLYNGSGPASDPGPLGDSRRLTFTASLTDDGPDVEVGVLGGIGRDAFTLEADYSGVVGQQGRVVLDADMNEGANHIGKYIVTGTTHTYVETSVVAGGGGNTIVMEDQIGGDVERVYTVELGDGDNSATIRFGDGVRGARPSTGQRTVTGSYRSGAGTGTVTLEADLVEPLTSDFTLDFGEGHGTVVGEYALPAEPASDPPPGVQAAPSQVKVLVLSPNESDLDFIARMADPEPADGADEPGEVAVVGTALRGARLDFLRLLDVSTSPDGGAGTPGEEWTIELGDLAAAGPATVTASSGGAVRRLVYVQDGVQLDAGASLDVTLQGHDGADAMLAHLLGISGDGAFDLVIDGGPGDDFGAALTGDLDPAGAGGLTFEARTGDGDDRTAIEAPADLQRGGPVEHLIDAGAGTDACWASDVVAALGCESREAITQQLLQILEELFGPELAGAWGGGG